MEMVRIAALTKGADPIGNKLAQGASAETYAILPHGNPPNGK